MNELFQILLSLAAIALNTINGALIIYVFSSLFCKITYSKKKFLFTTLSLLPFCILNLIIATMYSSLNYLMPIIAFLTCFIVLRLIYKPSKLKTIFILIAYFIYTFAMDLISVLFLSLIGKDPSFLSSNDINYLWGVIATNTFAIVLILSIYYIFSKKLTMNVLKENYKYIIYQATTIIICLLPSMYMMFSNFYSYSAAFVLINAIQLTIVSIFSIIYLKKGILFKDTELELENTKLHNKALSTINESIRGFKHDMGNMVQSINGYLAVGNIDGVKDYCQNLLHGFNDVNLLSILSPKVINEPALYGIVVGKMIYARENNLTLSLDIGIDVSKINFPSFELSRVIGILLDNAIEASLESEDKKLKLDMYYDKRKNADVIIIGNSVKNPKKVDIIKMFEKDYSTKENPSGFGLYEVLKFFKKYNKGDIVPNIDYDTNFFTQTVIFDK